MSSLANPAATPGVLAGTGELSLGAARLSDVATLSFRRLADYVTLSKPRIAVMSLLVVAAGYSLGLGDGSSAAPLMHSLIGIGLVAVASSVLNQVFEVETDSLMRRTMNRPLLAGRVGRWEAAAFGCMSGVAGVAWLLALVNAPTAIWSLVTLVLYVGVYTPLKRRLPLATTIGAIPGAMPPVLGWLASGRGLDGNALALFGILFLWQFPHFLAIAWMYREDYARAGLKMLPTRMEIPRLTGVLAFAYAVALIPVCLLPAMCGLAGRLYLLGALLLGIWYAAAALQFAIDEDRQRARRLLRVSLVFLPALLALLVWDHYRMLA